jgi:hypothetical protein
MKVVYRKPPMSAATKKKKEAARRKKKAIAKCQADPKVVSDKFKAAVPSATKISKLDYYDFLELKKSINKHLSKVRALNKKCNPDFILPRY